MADTSAAGTLNFAWDGVTPTTAPAGSIVLLAPGRDATIGIDVRGTFVATITLETSVDGLNWSAPSVTTIAGAASTATFSAPGSRLVAVSGAALLRARCSAYTSGTATVVMAGTPGGGGGASGGGGGAMTIADGADVAEGTTTDAGIITDVSGTVIGFLRGLVKQSITLLARLPSALISNRLDVNLGAAPATVTAQGVAAAGVPPSGNPVAMGITDGTNIQYAKASADGTNALLVAAAISGAGADGVTNVSTIKNAGGGTTPLSVAPAVYNGTTQDRARSVTSATGTTGTGLPGVGPVLWDAVGGVNYVKQAGDGSGRAMVVGAAAAGAALAGNPLRVGVSDGTNIQDQKQAGVANAAALTGFPGHVTYLSNLTNGDPMTGNINGATILNPGAVTTAQDSADQLNINCRGIYLFLNITAASGTGGLTPLIHVKDPGSAGYFAIASLGSAQTTTGLKCYLIYPGAPTVGALTAVVSQGIPRNWRLHISVGDSSSYTYTASVAYIL